MTQSEDELSIFELAIETESESDVKDYAIEIFTRDTISGLQSEVLPL